MGIPHAFTPNLPINVIPDSDLESRKVTLGIPYYCAVWFLEKGFPKHLCIESGLETQALHLYGVCDYV